MNALRHELATERAKRENADECLAVATDAAKVHVVEHWLQTIRLNANRK